MDHLDITNHADLTRCEAIIERGLKTFIEVGTALLEIRDNRLYRDTHKTFEAYCRERWGWSHRHANRMIEASEVANNLGPIGPKPTAESQVRPLARLEPEEQRDVWAKAVEASNGHVPTAAVVEEVTRKSAPDLDEQADEDDLPEPVTEELLQPDKTIYYDLPEKDTTNIHTLKLELARDINKILRPDDPLVKRLDEVIAYKDDFADQGENLASTLKVVGQRFLSYAEQFSTEHVESGPQKVALLPKTKWKEWKN